MQTKLTARKLKISFKTSIMDHPSLSDVVPITNGNQHFTHRETNWQSDTRKVCNRNSQLESAQSVPKDQSRIRSPNLVSFSMEKPITIESRTATVKLTPTGTANKNTFKKLSQTKNQIWMRCPYQVSRLIYKADSRIEIISYESVVPIRSPHFSDRLLNYWHRETNRTTLSYRIWNQNYFNQVSQTENNNYEWVVPIWCRYINEKQSAYSTPGDQLTNWYPEDMQSKLTAGNLKVRSKKSIMDHLSLSGIIMSKKIK